MLQVQVLQGSVVSWQKLSFNIGWRKLCGYPETR